MDVLEYWSPRIDWGRFKQGAISDPMWRGFKQLVQLCHCQEHWREVHHSLSLTRPPGPYYRPETAYARKKRRDEWKKPITAAEGHMHRAAHLACDKVAEMSYLITSTEERNPDSMLWLAVALSMGRSLGQSRARYKSVAFTAFDPSQQLADSDPSVAASLWLRNAGYTDELPLL